jgi:hypothetical protein
VASSSTASRSPRSIRRTREKAPPRPPARPARHRPDVTAVAAAPVGLTGKDNSENERAFEIRRKSDGTNWCLCGPRLPRAELADALWAGAHRDATTRGLADFDPADRGVPAK